MSAEEQAIEIPGYDIRRKLGEGGMATVYLAVQESLDREVALKVMSPALASDSTFCHRFLKEGKIAARLSHLNVLTVFDISAHGNFYYMATEYLPAGSARERMDDGLTKGETIHILCDVAHGLGYAHSHGIVHRDVKPGNILFRKDGTCVLADFGIAKAVDSKTMATMAGTSVGTPHYMSPEQARGAKVDGRSDIYSLGVVMYEMLTGDPPFDAEDPFAVALMHVNDAPPALPSEHSAFQPVLDKMLAKSVDDRFDDAEQVVDALEQVAEEVGSDTRRFGADRKRKAATSTLSQQDEVGSASEGGSKTPWLVLAAVLIVLLLAGAGTWLALQGGDAEPDGGTPVATSPAAAELVDQANRYYEQGRLMQPEDANALVLYREALTLDPDNAQAQEGIDKVARELVERAEDEWAAGREDQARTTVREALALIPDHQPLLSLQARFGASDDPADLVVPPVDEPPADSATVAASSDQVQSMLDKADDYVQSNRLTFPPGDNANALYKEVLAIDPGNPRAEAGLQEMYDKLVRLAENALSRDQSRRALLFIDAGLEVRPDDPRLLELKQQAGG